MSNNSVPSLDEILSLIKEIGNFDISQYVISTKDGKHSLDIAALSKTAPIISFTLDNENEFIHFEFSNGQSASLNKLENDWIVKERRSKGVYLIASDKLTKIGVADNPQKRLRTLQTGSPTLLELIEFWMCDNPKVVENFLHNQYANKRKNGEWFDLSQSDIDEIRRYFEDVNRQTT